MTKTKHLQKRGYLMDKAKCQIKTIMDRRRLLNPIETRSTPGIKIYNDPSPQQRTYKKNKNLSINSNISGLHNQSLVNSKNPNLNHGLPHFTEIFPTPSTIELENSNIETNIVNKRNDMEEYGQNLKIPILSKLKEVNTLSQPLNDTLLKPSDDSQTQQIDADYINVHNYLSVEIKNSPTRSCASIDYGRNNSVVENNTSNDKEIRQQENIPSITLSTSQNSEKSDQIIKNPINECSTSSVIPVTICGLANNTRDPRIKHLNNRSPLIRTLNHEDSVDFNNLSEAEKRNLLPLLLGSAGSNQTGISTAAQNQPAKGSSVMVTSSTTETKNQTNSLDNSNEKNHLHTTTYSNKDNLDFLNHILLQQNNVVGSTPSSHFSIHHPNSRKRSHPESEYFLTSPSTQPARSHQTNYHHNNYQPNSQVNQSSIGSMRPPPPPNYHDDITVPSSLINPEEESGCINSLIHPSTHLEYRRLARRLAYQNEYQMRQTIGETIPTLSRRQCLPRPRREQSTTTNTISSPKRIRCVAPHEENVSTENNNIPPTPEYLRQQYFFPPDHNYSCRGRYTTNVSGRPPSYINHMRQHEHNIMSPPIARHHLIPIHQDSQNDFPIDQADGNFPLQMIAFNADIASASVQRFDEMLAHLHELAGVTQRARDLFLRNAEQTCVFVRKSDSGHSTILQPVKIQYEPERNDYRQQENYRSHPQSAAQYNFRLDPHLI